MRVKDVLAAAAGKTPSRGYRWPSEAQGPNSFDTEAISRLPRSAMSDLYEHTAAELMEAAGYSPDGESFESAAKRLSGLQGAAMELSRHQANATQALGQAAEAQFEAQSHASRVEALEAQVADLGAVPVTQTETWDPKPDGVE